MNSDRPDCRSDRPCDAPNPYANNAVYGAAPPVYGAPVASPYANPSVPAPTYATAAPYPESSACPAAQPAYYVGQPAPQGYAAYGAGQPQAAYVYTATQPQPQVTVVESQGVIDRPTYIPMVLFFVGLVFFWPCMWVGSIWTCISRNSFDRIWGILNLVGTIAVIVLIIIICAIVFSGNNANNDGY
eukprot:m51a1_g2315 hypothetical protein (186) ;mRNA; f:483372-484047